MGNSEDEAWLELVKPILSHSHERTDAIGGELSSSHERADAIGGELGSDLIDRLRTSLELDIPGHRDSSTAETGSCPAQRAFGLKLRACASAAGDCRLQSAIPDGLCEWLAALQCAKSLPSSALEPPTLKQLREQLQEQLPTITCEQSRARIAHLVYRLKGWPTPADSSAVTMRALFVVIQGEGTVGWLTMRRWPHGCGLLALDPAQWFIADFDEEFREQIRFAQKVLLAQFNGQVTSDFIFDIRWNGGKPVSEIVGPSLGAALAWLAIYLQHQTIDSTKYQIPEAWLRRIAITACLQEDRKDHLYKVGGVDQKLIATDSQTVHPRALIVGLSQDDVQPTDSTASMKVVAAATLDKLNSELTSAVESRTATWPRGPRPKEPHHFERGWIEKMIDKEVEALSESGGWLVLIAPMGFGKSWFVSSEVGRYPDAIAHCIDAADTPAGIQELLANALEVEYRTDLAEHGANRAVHGANRLTDLCLQPSFEAALAQRTPAQRIYIDGADQLSHGADQLSLPSGEFLPRGTLLARLCRNLVGIITSRPNPTWLRSCSYESIRVVDLGAEVHRAAYQTELKQFLESLRKTPQSGKAAAALTNDLIARISKRASDATFFTLSRVAEEVLGATGGTDDRWLRPPEDLIKDYLNAISFNGHKEGASVVAALRDPLTSVALRTLIEKPNCQLAGKVEAFVSAARAFFVHGAATGELELRFEHPGYVRAIEEALTAVEKESAHRILANGCKALLQLNRVQATTHKATQSCIGYALRHVIAHFDQAGDRDAAIELLACPHLLQRRIQAGVPCAAIAREALAVIDQAAQ